MENSRLVQADEVFTGDTDGPLSIAQDVTVVIEGTHRGTVGVLGSGALVVRGELLGTLTLESLATATIEGDVVGAVETRVAGTLVIEADGRVAGPITNYGSCTNRGLRSGRVEGREPDDQPGSSVLEPVNGSGSFPPLPSRG